jgi:type IV pilus assembly protein PilQ
MNSKVLLLLAFFVTCVCSGFAQEEIISLNFKDTDIHIVLQALAEKSGVNVVSTPDVQGTVSIQLKDVPWATALDVLLKTYGYGYEWIDEKIVMVDTLDKLSERRQKEAATKAEAPLHTRVFALNFAKVNEVAGIVGGMLSERGRLTFDTRTNTLVITDTAPQLSSLDKTIRRLDKITPQVLIEAKVLETDMTLTQNIGVNWDLSLGLSGAKRPTSWPFSSSSGNKYLTEAFPAAGEATFSYGTLNASGLAATLELLLSDSNTKILSMPKVTTVDNNTALIKVVTEDPVPSYTFNSDTGQWEISGFETIEYGVVLEVTPQINDEGLITLSVKPEVSELAGTRDFTAGGSASTVQIPILDRQTTQTRVMVRDGDTLVIGGLIKDKNIDSVSKVPVLGDIPGLKYLFRHKGTQVVKKNLLIFITPIIVTPDMDLEKSAEELTEEEVVEAVPAPVIEMSPTVPVEATEEPTEEPVVDAVTEAEPVDANVEPATAAVPAVEETVVTETEEVPAPVAKEPVKDARACELYLENRAVLDAADAAIGRADRLK